jgi:hypothetical protein
MDWSTLREDENKILGCDNAAGPPRDARPFLFRASATAECERERMLPSDGFSMRLAGNVIPPILLQIPGPTKRSAVYRQR